MPKKSKGLTGLVWFGYIGEYKKPPCYIIRKAKDDEIFIDDFLRQFAGQKVQITIKEKT